MTEFTFIRKEIAKYGVNQVKCFKGVTHYIYEFSKDVYIFRIVRILDTTYWQFEKTNTVTNEFTRNVYQTFGAVEREIEKVLKGDEYESVRLFYKKNKRELYETAKGKTYKEFIEQLVISKYSILDFLSENEKQMLFDLSKKGE